MQRLKLILLIRFSFYLWHQLMLNILDEHQHLTVMKRYLYYITGIYLLFNILLPQWFRGEKPDGGCLVAMSGCVLCIIELIYKETLDSGDRKLTDRLAIIYVGFLNKS